MTIFPTLSESALVTAILGNFPLNVFVYLTASKTASSGVSTE